MIAVKVVSGPGELIGTCRQLMPPSSESSAIGTVPAVVVAWPTAATRFPLMAICCRTADEAPAGTGRTIVVQVVPLAVVHTAGWPSCDPTDTKPCCARGDREHLAGAGHVVHVMRAGPGFQVR